MGPSCASSWDSMAGQQPERKRTWINVVRVWIWTAALHGYLHLPRDPCPNW